jgi:hypothetical protein
MPVAIRPVKFQAPAEVSATGTSGSVTYNQRSGFNGSVSYVFRGLQAAADPSVKTIGTDPACAFNTANPDADVAAGKANVSTFTTPANVNYVRFQTFQADASPSAHDLDMFLYRAAPGSSSYSLLATSGGPDSNEFIGSNSTLLTTAGTSFKVYVHACGVDAPGGSYVLNTWALTSPSSNPFTAFPGTTPVTTGQVVPATFSWANLLPGNRYLGRVQPVDTAVPATALAQTLIFVNTR